ncbi:MAG TPA: lipase family protein [Terriglobales bacterium]|nr:lipase family protein [Terriglobales bacterium]
MSRTIPYSADRDDLFYPCKRAEFFQSGAPSSDAVLCVELARLAYCRLSESFGLDRDRIRKVLGKVGFTGCHFFESPRTTNGRGVHAFIALRQDLSVVSFRGTDKDDPSDLGDDIDLRLIPWSKGGRVHCGFSGALGQLFPEIQNALQDVTGRLLFTGHSLGAAMATLLASLQPSAALYTFGCPRVGDEAFVSTLFGVAHSRYVDCCDLVARVPPRCFGYADLGPPLYIDREGKVHQDPPEDFITTDRIIAAGEYLEQYAWRIGDVSVRELADHAPVNYVYAVRQG